MSRPLTAMLAFALVFSGCDIVDETGYLCEDGTRVSSPQMCADFYNAEVDEGVDSVLPEDEPGESDADAAGGAGGLLLTSQMHPGIDPVPMTVVGLPGTISLGDVVTLRHGSSIAEAVESGTSFIGTIDATAGDVIDVMVGAVVIGSVQVAAWRTGDDTEADTLAPAFPESADDGLIAGGAELGMVDIGDGDLAGFVAPYVVYNASTGVVVLVGVGDTDATITAGIGDELCIARMTDGLLDAAVCVTVRG